MIRLKCVAVIVLCFFLTGCGAVLLFGAGTAAGIAGYKYYEGTLSVVFEAPFTETWDASLTSLERMNVKVESADHDLTSGTIRARRSDKKPVSITIKYKSAKETEAVIRVGHLGDNESSEAVKEEIRKVLFDK